MEGNCVIEDFMGGIYYVPKDKESDKRKCFNAMRTDKSVIDAIAFVVLMFIFVSRTNAINIGIVVSAYMLATISLKLEIAKAGVMRKTSFWEKVWDTVEDFSALGIGVAALFQMHHGIALAVTFVFLTVFVCVMRTIMSMRALGYICRNAINEA